MAASPTEHNLAASGPDEQEVKKRLTEICRELVKARFYPLPKKLILGLYKEFQKLTWIRKSREALA